jgi:hypothetical protein
MMSIKGQVEDAIYLAKDGRFAGVLTTLMLAVAASSRKVFPDGTSSLKKPKEPMRDNEAFTLFLGGRIKTLLFREYEDDWINGSGVMVRFKEKHYDIAYILYKFYRCELVHNGELPEDIEFAPSQRAETSGLSVSINSGDKMVLDYGWLDLLIKAVVEAECNGQEFGITHYRLAVKSGIDEPTFINNLVTRFGITPGRLGFGILKHVVKNINPQRIMISSDKEVVGLLIGLVKTGVIDSGDIRALSRHRITESNGTLTTKGLEIIRLISEAYRRNKV